MSPETMTPREQNPGGHRGEMLTGSVREQEKNAAGSPPRQPLRERLAAQAVPFLACLLNCTEDEAWTRPMTWQRYGDLPERKTDANAVKRHGSLDQYAEEMERYNLRGDSICIAINETDLKGREKKNIIAPRAAWADLDLKDATEPFSMEALPLPPTMAVRSGHGVHLYWCFDNSTPYVDDEKAEHEALLRGIQKALVHFGADTQVCQVAGVLRVPGFYNMKREPVMVEVIR